MSTIALEGMEFYAFHGYYQREKTAGNYYRVDVWVDLDLDLGKVEDELEKTVNYETIFETCKKQMEHSCNLIETVAHNIMEDLAAQIKNAQKIRLKVSKLAPPLPGRVERAYIEVEKVLAN